MESSAGHESKRVVLVSGHYLGSRRKAGFHWLAEAYRRAGWDVLFVTTGFSWLSYLRRDYRLAYGLRGQANQIRTVDGGVSSFVWFTPWHPANLRLSMLNRLSRRIFARYGELPLADEVQERIRRADLIIFESVPGLMLVERFRRINPQARYVYRVSDDLRQLRCHPVVIEAEAKLAAGFDLISAPSEYIHRHFDGYPRAVLHRHGLNKAPFDQPCPSPYDKSSPTHCIFVGNSRFDADFVRQASSLFPAWCFHIIGPIPKCVSRPNVRFYGELPFADTVPYVVHADIGLQTLAYVPGAESFTDSLKVIQYTYCRLPIVAPEFLRCSRSNFCYYRPGEPQSIEAALKAAAKVDRASIDRSGILSWDDLAGELAGNPAAAGTGS